MFPLKSTFFFLGAFFLLSACNDGKNEPGPQAYALPVPVHFPQPVLDTDNPMTEAGIALGRMLFYDVRLSGNNQVSCASCHRQSLAFSDGTPLTRAGVSGTPLLRHSPALINMAWATNGLFWDGGSTNLESQAFGPLTAHDEMAQNLEELMAELNAVPEYVNRFRMVFNDEIKSQYVAKALAQFQRTLISANSRYDQYKTQKGGTLSSLELKGMSLVAQKCQGCHSGELFTDNGYHNNGIDAEFTDREHDGLYLGRYRVTYIPSDLGNYKTPTLRNSALTAPYMHDGRFATLEDVIDHYSDGIRYSNTLDPLLPAGGMKLSGTEKEAIVAFLKTLTDLDFSTNPNFSSPFK